jgi:hypothetical protein
MKIEPCAALPVGWFHLSVVLPPGRAYVAQEWGREAEREWAAWEQSPAVSRGQFSYSDDLVFNEDA